MMLTATQPLNHKVNLFLIRDLSKIPYLRIVGTRTLAIKPGDPLREVLYPPWCDSGFVVAPLIIEYGMQFFKYRR